MTDDDRFWAATERAEERFTGDHDVLEFAQRMRRLGHEHEIVRERVEAIHPELLSEFDKLTGRQAPAK